MLRKLSLTVLLIVLATTLMSVSADASTDGCYVKNTVLAVNEGLPITVSIECANILPINEVFGFQFGTTVTVDGIVGSLPTTYAPGTFSTLAVGGEAGTFVGANTLPLYGVSRQTGDYVGIKDFSLGTLALTAETNRGTGSGLTDDDGSVVVELDTDLLKLSTDLGASLPNVLRTVYDVTIVVTDIDLAWLSGSATVQSDSASMTGLKDFDLNLGGKHFTADTTSGTTTATGHQTVLAMVPAYTYVNDTGLVNTATEFDNFAAAITAGAVAAAPASDNTLNIAVTADMYGHLACSTSAVDLGDVGGDVDVTDVLGIGTSGVITLKAGDATKDGFISNSDATAIGLDFGDTGVAINALAENDINLDGTVNILDLVQVGRNFSAVGQGTAVTTCS